MIEALFASKSPDGIVTSEQIVDAIRSTAANLGKVNTANFLKDIIRTERANENWPDYLKTARWTARQRYGSNRVFQFVEYVDGQEEPFPDRFLPDGDTQTHLLQAASMSSVARQLGRTDEPWLTQVAVNLRLVETQLALFSPIEVRVHLKEVTHLQMSVKTAPEIDAVYLATYGSSAGGPEVQYALVTCEAKQRGERLLEDQIREQVRVALSNSQDLEPSISGVKPMALQVRTYPGTSENVIYAVEFQEITREEFASNYAPTDNDPERLYCMPLTAISRVFYRLQPPVRGINA